MARNVYVEKPLPAPEKRRGWAFVPGWVLQMPVNGHWRVVCARVDRDALVSLREKCEPHWQPLLRIRRGIVPVRARKRRARK